MKRIWQIFHLEDQPSKKDYSVIAISDKILSVLRDTVEINKQIISIKGLLEKGGYYFGEDDFYWNSEDIFIQVEDMIQKNENFMSKQKRRIINQQNFYDYRFPIYYISTILSDGWSMIDIFDKMNVDIIILDIKMHQVAKTNNKLDHDDSEIMESYLNQLSNPKDVFSTKNLKLFREMGGIVIFGKLMRILRNKKHQPIIVIQTASSVIDQYSSLEFAFPDYVIVTSKIQTDNQNDQTIFYHSLFDRVIKNMFENGEISSFKLEECFQYILDNLPSEDVEYYKNAINFNLDAKNDGWVFGALFPWIARDILFSNSKENIIEAVQPLKKYFLMNDWASELNVFFERLPLRFLTHPHPSNIQESLPEFLNEEKDWNGNLEKLFEKGLNHNIRSTIFEKTPDFVKDAIRNPIKTMSHIQISEFAKYLSKIPDSNQKIVDHRRVFASTKTSQYPCIVDQTNTDYPCKKISCDAYWLCKLENEKDKFKGNPVKKIIELINLSMKKIPDVDVYQLRGIIVPQEINNSIIEEIKIIKIQDHFTRDIDHSYNTKIERCYIPWHILEELFSKILLFAKEKMISSAESPKVGFSILVSSEEKKLFFLINSNIVFPNLLEHSLGNGTFDRCLRSLNYWVKIYIYSQKILRNIFLSKNIEYYPEIDRSINGTLYIISLSYQ